MRTCCQVVMFLLLILVSPLAVAQTAGQQGATALTAQAATNQATSALTPGAMQATGTATGQLPSAGGSGYVLGPGDQIRIAVFGEKDLTGDYLIDDSGNITVPLIGPLSAAGRTTDWISHDVAEELAKQGYVQNARVTASVVAYRPFYILGEVQRPGAYPYMPNLTVPAAVATAGGYTYRANKRSLFLRRAGDNTERRIDDRLPRVQPGDTIRVGERMF